ncbi:MAG: hypothetical protein WCA61_03305 [Nitrososphaeraceae archaeon]
MKAFGRTTVFVPNATASNTISIVGLVPTTTISSSMTTNSARIITGTPTNRRL